MVVRDGVGRIQARTLFIQVAASRGPRRVALSRTLKTATPPEARIAAG
jgi:hypothetical protein